MLLSAKLMLDHLKETEAAQRLEHAIAEVIREGKQVTYDLGGTAGTREMGDAIIAKLTAPQPLAAGHQARATDK